MLVGKFGFISTTIFYFLVASFTYWILKIISASKNIYLVLFSSLFALYTAEASLRYIFRYPLTYSEKNDRGYVSFNSGTGILKDIEVAIYPTINHHFIEFDSGEVRTPSSVDGRPFAPETYNKVGLRGSVPHGKNIFLTIGDSFTEGIGTTSDSTYPVLLEKHLQNEWSQPEVLNAGVSGSDPFFQWLLFKKLEKQFAIKNVVFLLNTTDMSEVVTRGGLERFRPNGTVRYSPLPWWERLYGISFVSRLIIHNILGYNYNLMAENQQEKAYQLAAKKIGILFENKIIPYCKEHSINVVIAIHPLKDEVVTESSNYNLLEKNLKK